MHAPGKINHIRKTVLAFAVSLVSLAPSFANGLNAQQNPRDTAPTLRSNREAELSRDKDIDGRIQQLEKAMLQVEKQLQEKDWEKMQRQLEASLNKIDMGKIQEQIESAMKKIDLDKAKVDADAAMKKIDMEKIREEIKAAMAKVTDKARWKEMDTDLKQALKEAERSIEEAKKIDFEKMKKELQKSKTDWEKQKVNIEKNLQEAREELKKNKFHMQEELSKAKENIGKAKEELQGYKSMINDMELAGLLNTSTDYSIQYKGDELFINGKKQNQEITDRYKRYFKKGDTIIKKVKGEFSINSDTDN